MRGANQTLLTMFGGRRRIGTILTTTIQTAKYGDGDRTTARLTMMSKNPISLIRSGAENIQRGDSGPSSESERRRWSQQLDSFLPAAKIFEQQIHISQESACSAPTDQLQPYTTLEMIHLQTISSMTQTRAHTLHVGQEYHPFSTFSLMLRLLGMISACFQSAITVICHFPCSLIGRKKGIQFA